MITLETNRNGRHILYIRGPHNLDQADQYQREQIDAVLITAETSSEAIRVLMDINPIVTDLTCYKPFFCSRNNRGQLRLFAEIVDGYADQPDDAEMAETIEQLRERYARIGMHRFLMNVDSPHLILVRVCRYLMTRGRTKLHPVLVEGSALGYITPILDLILRLKNIPPRDLLAFYNSLVDMGYVRETRFINRIYLCPDCGHSHLLYIECCPRCGGSAIKAEEVIHHFRCANISPEHTYNFGGQLRCPKCHEMLRHIGVDYDRPATTYACDACGADFVQPAMKAVCTNCHKEHKVDSLIYYDSYDYEFTDEGMRAFVSPETHLRLQSEYYENLQPYEGFIL